MKKRNFKKSISKCINSSSSNRSGNRLRKHRNRRSVAEMTIKQYIVLWMRSRVQVQLTSVFSL